MPLTLAIIPALMVRTGGQRFAIPQVSLLELVYLDEEQSKTAIEYVRGAAIYRLRGEILPVVRLASVLGLQPTATDGTNIIVLAVGARRYGLLVDAVQDTEEIVIKPLHSQFKRLGVYSGATVLGDGGIALILDLAGVALKGGIDLTAHREEAGGAELVPEKRTQRQSMVVFLAGEGGQCAVPLSMVARLEQIPLGSIERAASSEVVQYHQGILPIVRPESVLSLGQRPGASEDQPLIVFDFGHAVGMAVNEILDIVEVEVERDPAQDKPFTLGTVVVFGRTTLVLDVYQIMRDLAPQFVTERRRSARPPRILLVDDSTAMRAALAGYLRSCGLKVVDVGSAPAALKELRGANEAAFDALITDLEMPDVDGFELLATVKRERPGLPCFAWTSHEEPEVIDRALAVGARACISKLKREELMEHFAKHGIGLRRGEDRRSA
jgi:two-component system chemotaxis sensor kinase CheA